MVFFCWDYFTSYYNDGNKEESAGGGTEKNKDIVFWNKEVRFGMEGLYDCGFEYRMVERNSINCDEMSLSSNVWEEKKDEENSSLEQSYQLHHIASNAKVTSSNWKKFLLPNNDHFTYNRVVKCCQEMTQHRIQNEFEMSFLPIPSQDSRLNLNLLVSNDLLPCDIINNDTSREKIDCPILLILPGKGESRAGILSTRHLTQSSMEEGSCTFHIKEAQKRGYSIILADSNAYGKHMKAQCLIESLRYIFNSLLSFSDTFDASDELKSKRKIHILAHSASGGYFIRHLLDDQNMSCESKMLSCSFPIENIESLVFTDSTHNIQWLKNKKSDDCHYSHHLTQFLQSEKCLYIKNNSEHPSETFANHKDKPPGSSFYSCNDDRKKNNHHCTPGELHHKRRFGAIPTVWAGTTDHSAMCWVARNVIWQFFDRALEQ
jgi:hypothetical protein